jgi:hypothetical protein
VLKKRHRLNPNKRFDRAEAGYCNMKCWPMSLMGQTLRSQSTPAPTFVRYASRSDQILRRSQITRRAMCGRLRVGKPMRWAAT